MWPGVATMRARCPGCVVRKRAWAGQAAKYHHRVAIAPCRQTGFPSARVPIGVLYGGPCRGCGHVAAKGFVPRPGLQDAGGAVRSEEHTSELQSRGPLVCRRQLENK